MLTKFLLVLIFMNPAGEHRVVQEIETVDDIKVSVVYDDIGSCVEAGEKRAKSAAKQVPWLHTVCVPVPPKGAFK